MSYTKETKGHARRLYVILLNHVLEWMSSYQGMQSVTRHQLRETLNLNDEELDLAIDLLRNFAASQGWPSVTSIIEFDGVIRVHDVITQLNRKLSSSVRMLPTYLANEPVEIDDEKQEWIIHAISVPGSGFCGTVTMRLKGDERRLDSDLLHEYYDMLL